MNYYYDSIISVGAAFEDRRVWLEYTVEGEEKGICTLQEQPEGTTALIILPLYYNPDEQGHRKTVERRKYVASARELTKLFGGCTLHWDPKTGFWGKHKVIMEDDVVAMEVDIPNTLEAKGALLRHVRNVLVPRFRQEAIYCKFLSFVNVQVVERD